MIPLFAPNTIGFVQLLTMRMALSLGTAWCPQSDALYVSDGVRISETLAIVDCGAYVWNMDRRMQYTMSIDPRLGDAAEDIFAAVRNPETYVERTAAHEIGHALGLGHLGPGTVMYGGTGGSSSRPTPADVASFWTGWSP